MSKRAFTWTELLIVLGIAAVSFSAMMSLRIY